MPGFWRIYSAAAKNSESGLMQALSIPQTRRALISLSSLAILISFFLPAVYAANIGTVVPVMGIVADLIYDSARNLVYLANSSRSEVDIYSVGERRLVGSVATGTLPSSLALSPDFTTLYIASAGSNTINTINLNTRQRGNDYNVGSRPDAIAVGNDGKVVILGTGGLQRLDTATGRITPVPISPPPTPPGGLLNIPGAIITNSTFAGLVTTASGNLIIGRSINLTVPGAANRLFVYEVASGVVLRSRNVTGLASILSASTDGSRFMAGPLLFDTQTLTILGRTGNVLNANLGGGSAFSVDGNSVYASFNNAAACCAQTPINPLNPNNPQNPATPGVVTPGGGGGFPGGGFGGGGVPPAPAQSQQTVAVLQILRSSSLTPQLGLRLAEQITSKIIASPDGQYLFATSTSGLMVIPVGQLNNLPILDVSSTNVVLSRDMCNRTIATATVQIRNAGGGRLTFAANVTNTNAQVILNQRSGVAPATLTISYDPRQTTTRGTTQYVVALISPEAVNVEPAILVNLN